MGYLPSYLRLKLEVYRDFPGGPVAKTPSSQCRGPIEKMCNVRAVSYIFFGAKWGLQPGRQHLRQFWETAPKVVGGRSIYKISKKGESSATKRLLYKRFPASHKELMSPRRDFSDNFLDMKRWRDCGSCFSGTPLLFQWSNGCWQFDLWFLCLF